MIIKRNLNSVFNNGLIRLRAKNEFNSLYIYYLLINSSSSSRKYTMFQCSMFFRVYAELNNVFGL